MSFTWQLAGEYLLLAEARQQTILFIDGAGFYPLPSVVRAYVPIGQTPLLRGWCTHDHSSGLAAIAPAGKVGFHSQDGAIHSADVVALLEQLAREASGRMVIVRDGGPLRRRQVIQGFLTTGAAPRIHPERLPAYAPELNPGEGIWQQLKGVEPRNVCCVDLPRLRHELRDAGRRLRRKREPCKGVSMVPDFRGLSPAQ